VNDESREHLETVNRFGFAATRSVRRERAERPPSFKEDSLMFRTLSIFVVFSLAASALAQDKKPSDPPPRDPALRAELVKRMKAEQDVREELAKVAPLTTWKGPDVFKRPEVKPVFEKMERIDKDNLAWLKIVVAEKGWPTKSMVGRDGANGAFLIAQHATSDLEFMNTVLGRLKKAYQTGDAEGQWIALMTDRLLVLREKKKQLYGTQLEARDGKMVPQPIEDEATVDKRRKELGMPPLADYLKFVNEHSSPPKTALDKDAKPKST